jgi:hypothetical protein
MRLVFGQRMVRLDDGMQGTVAQDGPELRIVYLDRGEERMAAKSENWVVDELDPGPLRPSEVFLVAATADRALRAYEKNEPHKYWETIPLTYEPYDPGLVRTISDYLNRRKTRPAG